MPKRGLLHHPVGHYLSLAISASPPPICARPSHSLNSLTAAPHTPRTAIRSRGSCGGIVVAAWRNRPRAFPNASASDSISRSPPEQMAGPLWVSPTVPAIWPSCVIALSRDRSGDCFEGNYGFHKGRVAGQERFWHLAWLLCCCANATLEGNGMNYLTNIIPVVHAMVPSHVSAGFGLWSGAQSFPLSGSHGSA